MMKKRILSVLLSLAMIISSVLPVYAQEQSDQQDTTETIICEVCGGENSHLDDCSALISDASELEDEKLPLSCGCPAEGHTTECLEYTCEECGQLCNTDAGHAVDCLTLCTCTPVDGAHEQGCTLFSEEIPEAPEKNEEEGDATEEPVCTCDPIPEEGQSHSEDCALYEEPETVPVPEVCEGCAEDGSHLDTCEQYVCPECGVKVNLSENTHAEDCSTLKFCSCDPMPEEGQPHNEGCDFYVPFCGHCAGTLEHEENCITNCTCPAEEDVDKSAEDFVHTAEDCPFSTVQPVNTGLLSGPMCNCSSNASNIANHTDGCARKEYCKEWNSKSAEEIYAAWNTFDLALKQDVLNLIQVYDANKYAQLMELMGSNVPEFPDCTCGEDFHAYECALHQEVVTYAAERDVETLCTEWEHLAPEVQLAIRRMLRTEDEEKALALDEALSVTISTENVSVYGVIPKDVKLVTVAKPVAECPQGFLPYVSGAENIHFLLDISPRYTSDNSYWQPADGDTVMVTVDVSAYGMEEEGVYTILHEKKDGTVENLHSHTVENGMLSFEMSSFSHVAGLTPTATAQHIFTVSNENYICFDLRAGDVIIKADSYEGYRFDNNGNLLQVSATGSTENKKFYVYQSTASNRESIKDTTLTPPVYDSFKTSDGKEWDKYITNNTDVTGVIDAWNDSTKKGGREETGFRIDVSGNIKAEMVLDNVWSDYQNGGHGKNNNDRAGLCFKPAESVNDLYLLLKIKGDNRLSSIHYASTKGYNQKLCIEDYSVTGNDSNGQKSVNTITLADPDTTFNCNHYDAAIGGHDNNGASAGIEINSGIVYAGTTYQNDCTAIGGGGNGYGGVTINGGIITAVSYSSGTAIGGGIGKTDFGGTADVLITGGKTYAYNHSSYYNSEVIPAAAIGGGSSSAKTAKDSTVRISGGFVFAQTIGGTAIGGGSSTKGSGGSSTVEISGGAEVIAISKTGDVCSVNGVVGYRNYPAGSGIGGGMGGIGGGVHTDNSTAVGDGGNCTLTISGSNTKVYTGSIGGGGVHPDNTKDGKIGNAEVTINDGFLQGQVLMAAGAAKDCFFIMNGGTIDNYEAEKATKIDINTTSENKNDHRIYLTRKVTINGQETDKVFTFLKPNGSVAFIENGEATINSGTIRNAQAANGGAFYVIGGNLTVQKEDGKTAPVIENCTAENDGGAVCVMNGTAAISGGTITGNTDETVNEADKGGAVYVGGGTFTMKNTGTAISNCNAVTAGGAVCVENGSATIEGGSISQVTSVNGGAVYVGGDKDSNSSFTMSAGSISDFTADKNGGAVCVMNGTATISGGTITGNTDETVNEADKGGAVYVGGGTFTMKNTENTGTAISDCNAVIAGGAVCVENGSATVSGGTISNVHSADGGAIYVGGDAGSNSTFKMTNTGSISNFYADNNGGAVCVMNGTAAISGGTITGNASVDEAKRGGAVYVGGGSFTMDNSSADGVNSCNATEAGGAVCVENGSATINGGIIKNNTSKNGGAVYVGGDKDSESSFTMSGDGKIIACSASENGGAVCVMNGSATLVGSCGIEGNDQSDAADAANGGAIYVGGGSFEMNSSESTIENFYAAQKGGAVCVEGGTVIIFDGKISTSKANLGGGVYVSGTESEFVMEGGTVEKCTAIDGGGVYVGGTGSEFVMKGGTVETCTAVDGGGVYVGSGDLVNLTLGTIKNCKATNNGGGAYVLNTDVTFGENVLGSNIIITGNTAVDGAGLYINQNKSKADNANHVTTIANGLIENNIASGNGGGIYHTGAYGECEVSGSGQIIKNEAQNGAGIYIADGSQLTVKGGHITENTAVGTPSGETSAQNDAKNIGVGGGVYVKSNGGENPSSFTLVSNDSAGIYNNKADFAADDVYANETNTSLDLPADIKDMALGDGFTANGWYGDYVVEDNYYADSMLYPHIEGGASEVKRYRTVKDMGDTTTYEVVLGDFGESYEIILDGKKISMVNIDDKYVCLTIGKTAINFGTLTIKKDLPNGIELPDNQFFVFNVKADELLNTSLGSISFDVAIKGEGEIVITRVPFGTYTITEDENWSWRYEVVGDDNKSQTVIIDSDTPEQEVTFTNQIRTDKDYNGLWLDGNSDHEVNIYGQSDKNTGELSETETAASMSFFNKLVSSWKGGDSE